MQDATLRRLTLVFILASAIAGFLALSYSSVWAHPAQQDTEETAATASNDLVITPSTDTAHTFDGDIVTVVVDEGTVASGQRTLTYVPVTLEEAMAEAPDPPAGAVYGATVFRINLLGIVVATLITYTAVGFVFGVEMGVLPACAAGGN